MRMLLSLTLILAVAPGAPAADPPTDADARARTIAPYLDDQVIGIYHLDLTRLDVDAVLTKAGEMGKFNPAHWAPTEQAVRRAVAAFRQAGGKEIYAVFSLADLPESFFVVVPVGDGADA